MATYILDEALGFVPNTKTPSYQNFRVAAASAAKIYKFGPVLVSGGYLVPAAITGPVTGIALEHMDAAPGEITEVSVCTDPSQVFAVKADAVGDITDVGKYVSLVANAGSNDHSTATVKISTATGTWTANTPFIVVGWQSTRVTNAPAASDLHCLVKLVTPQFDKGATT